MARKIYNDEELFNNWLESVSVAGVTGLSKGFSDLIIQYCKDMSLGLNVSKKSKKGGRSKKRINASRQKIIFVLKKLEERKIKSFSKLKKEDLHTLFDDMRTGKISNRYGKPYKSAGDYVKDFKSFFHWYQKVSGVKVDITEELDRRGEKPKFVYFTEEEFNTLVKKASRDTQLIMSVLFDSGCRVREGWNIQVKDFSSDFKELTIKEETSKTFGRKIKLMMCSKVVKDYIKELGLSNDDYLFQKTPIMTNRELTLLGKTHFKEKTREKNFTLYDIRHSSACFWVVRYKSESALKYRFGWKKSDMIVYYTEFLGMKDTISDDDLYLDVTKTELEKQMKEQQQTIKDFEKRLKDMEDIISSQHHMLDLKDKIHKQFKSRFKTAKELGLE